MIEIGLEMGAGVRAGAVAGGMPEGRIVMPMQTHTANVGVLTEEMLPAADDGDCGRSLFPDTDALITQLRNVAIGVRTADCVPIILYAPDIEAVAAVHAGWKGTYAGICINTVAKLKEMGADPRKMRAAMGPCICGKCYEVDTALAGKFRERFGDFPLTPGIAPGKYLLDLPAVNRRQLLDCGLSEANIHLPTVCTLESAAWPSWRRTPGTPERLFTLIQLGMRN